jgi:hypothetical protein
MKIRGRKLVWGERVIFVFPENVGSDPNLGDSEAYS